MQFHIPYHLYTDSYPTKRLALYHALRDCIVSGMLGVDTKLPSSRELATLYGMSRGTVSQVYDMLASEGYMTSGVGRGTFVAYRPPEEKPDERSGQGAYVYSDWGSRLQALNDGRAEAGAADKDAGAKRGVDFRAAGPDPESFPDAEWNRCLFAQTRLLAEARPRRVRTSVLGDEALRECLAQYLRRVRGIAADARHIAVFSGSMQAIALTAQLFIDPGDRVVIENPCYTGAADAFQAAGGVCVPAPVDDQGIIPEPWKAKLLFVTPNRQFPTGAVLPLERRQRLLAWASANQSLIVEDDYDSEFRHRGKSLEPLKVLDREGRVLYMGSFSNTLLPHVRIGYAVLPEPLIPLFAKAKALFDPRPCNLLEQRTLAAWMQSGDYERNLRRMKRVYGRKFRQLRELFSSLLSPWFTWIEGDAGLSVFGWWNGAPEQYVRFRSACREAGIHWSDTSVRESDAVPVRYGAFFYFPHLTEEAMTEGVRTMERIGKALGAL
ncbi:PLP-dependent aminotransferase family protein [Paenibacillus hodogayensis]|uniref:PLP-dependent aminotransferase family protein n=1 Tax=Paenibacillus hodogayensis TaxID=279208 RepID=A0ABV5W4V5_9BACL